MLIGYLQQQAVIRDKKVVHLMLLKHYTSQSLMVSGESESVE